VFNAVANPASIVQKSSFTLRYEVRSEPPANYRTENINKARERTIELADDTATSKEAEYVENVHSRQKI